MASSGRTRNKGLSSGSGSSEYKNKGPVVGFKIESEPEPPSAVDDFQSPLFVNGFVIITPNENVDAHEDELTLAGWISNRLLKMKITPRVVSLNALRLLDEENPQNYQVSDEKELEMLMSLELEESCPLWKSVVKKDMGTKTSSKPSKNIEVKERSVDVQETRHYIIEVHQLYKSLKEIVVDKMESMELVWVLIVPNEFKTSLEVDMLHAMAEQYDFRVLALSNPYKSNILRMLVAIAERKEEIVWQKDDGKPSGDKNRRLSKRKSKSKRQVNKKVNKSSLEPEETVLGCRDIKTLHKENSYYQHSPRNVSLERIMSEDYDNDTHISTYPESIKSDESDESSTFEMGEENLFMCLNQAAKTVIPPPLSPKEYFRENDSKEASMTKSLVIIIRDMMGCNNNSLSLARTINERLKKMVVKSYVITVPNILKDLQAVRLTKEHAVRIAFENDKDLLDGYIRIILAIIANKMKNKSKRVIIIDIGDETPVRLWPVKDFCMRLHAEIFTLDSLPEEQFESKLSKVIHEVSKRYKEMDWTTPVPIYDGNDNCIGLSASQQVPRVPSPPFLLSLERKLDLIVNETTDNELAEESISERSSGSALNVVGCQRTSALIGVSVPENDSNDSQDISGDVSDFDESQSSPRSNAKPSANKTKRRKKRKALDQRSTASIGAKSKASEILNSFKENNNSTPNTVETDSNDSRKLHMDEILSPKQNLLLIQKIPDDSRYPSRLSSKLIKKDTANCDDTYKGWVAVANNTPGQSTRHSDGKFRTKSKIRPEELPKNKDGLFKRLLRPVGHFLTCQYCRSSRNSAFRVSPEERLGYKGISLENSDPL